MTLNTYSCLASISLSLRDKSHSSIEAPRIKLEVRGFLPREMPSPAVRRRPEKDARSSVLITDTWRVGALIGSQVKLFFDENGIFCILQLLNFCNSCNSFFVQEHPQKLSCAPRLVRRREEGNLSSSVK